MKIVTAVCSHILFIRSIVATALLNRHLQINGISAATLEVLQAPEVRSKSFVEHDPDSSQLPM